METPHCYAARMFQRCALMMTSLLALALPLPGCSQPAPTDVATLDEARALHAAGKVWLVDIREPEEHATGVAQGALLLPMSQLGRRLAELPKDPQRPVLLICRTQNRSSRTLRALRENGHPQARYVHGGMSEWARRGWPMIRPAASGGG